MRIADSVHPGVFAFAQLGRAGLANMMFPWARCEVFSHVHAIPMLAPRWTHIKLGPILRRERDKRFYIGLFDNYSYLGGPRKLAIMSRGQRIKEPTDLMQMPAAARDGTEVIWFEGMEGWFTQLHAHRDFLVRRLVQILSDKQKARLADPSLVVAEPHITVHVRRGDKKVLEIGEPQPKGEAARTPHINWFANSVKSIRQLLGKEVPARVFSEAGADVLRPLLDLPNTTLAPPSSAIADIFMLARGKILVTTGTSSFSSWAAFLGEMGTIWYPGTTDHLDEVEQEYAVKTDVFGELPASAEPLLRAAWQR